MSAAVGAGTPSIGVWPTPSYRTASAPGTASPNRSANQGGVQ
jgi:hypothetical protein